MARQSTGGVVEKTTATGGTSYSLRFRALGERQFVHLGHADDGWTRAKAEDELAYVIAQVRRGTWQPPAPPAAVELPPADPTFHEFASEWWAAKKLTVRPNTVAAYENELTVHLLPFFARHRLSQITVREVDRYRDYKVREGRLSAETINKTLTRLGQVLDVAEERELISRNPLRINPRNRKLKVHKKQPVYLDSAEHITALLQAASDLDAGKGARTSGRRALLATLVFAGLRVSEACALRWRDVDLAAGRISVGSAKTDAGIREVDIRAVLRDELLTYKAGRRRIEYEDLVFTTAARTRRDKDNVRSKVIEPVLKRADQLLAAADAMPLPTGVTSHKLRHTFASILAALGEDPAYVMRQMGHTDPVITIGLYTHVMSRSDDEKARLKALVDGAEWAPLGTSHEIGLPEEAESPARPAGFEPATSRSGGTNPIPPKSPGTPENTAD